MPLGIKAGLLSRLNLQEQTIMQLQSDSLKHELSQQQHKSEVEQLQYQLAERDKEVSALRSELVRREKTVDKQRVELEDAMRHIEELQFAQVCVVTQEYFFSPWLQFKLIQLDPDNQTRLFQICCDFKLIGRCIYFWSCLYVLRVSSLRYTCKSQLSFLSRDVHVLDFVAISLLLTNICSFLVTGGTWQTSR